MKDTYTEIHDMGATSHLDFDRLSDEEKEEVKIQLVNAVGSLAQIFHPRCGVVLLVRDPENEKGHLKFVMGQDNMQAMALALTKTVEAHADEFNHYEEIKRKLKTEKQTKIN